MVFEWFTTFMSEDPTLRLMQAWILLASVLLLFLLLYTLRDIVLRTRSFGYQFLCVLLVGALPILGFLLYLLIRPARTIKEREVEEMLKQFLGEGEILPEELDESPPEDPEPAEDLPKDSPETEKSIDSVSSPPTV